MKVSTCFHTGYFIQKQLFDFTKPSQVPDITAANTASFNTYVQDFCNTYVQQLPMRTEFVKALKDFDEKATFEQACFALQSDTSPMKNAWFDPIDPQASITQQEVCDLHFALFQMLKEKQRTSLAEFVSFSYLASLDLFINANMQEDFECCVNLDVAEQPNQWTTQFVTNNAAFRIWLAADQL